MMKIRLLLTLFLSLVLASTVLQAESLKILDEQGKLVVKLTRDGERIKVKDAANQELLKAKPRDGDGRKYKDHHGAVVAKISGDDEGFKLKTEHGSLIWKVRYKGDKIKISPRDDNILADVLKRKGAAKWALQRDGQTYAKLKYYPDKRKIKAKDEQNKTRFQIKNTGFSPALGVLLIPGIQPEEAYIIMAEIWVRGW